MTERLFGVVKGHREHIADHTGRLYSDSEIADLLNTVYEENEQLKSDVYDWKASAEDYLKLGKSLKKENEQLKNENAKMKKELSLLAEFNQKAIL